MKRNLVDEVLEILEDGKFHSLKEVMSKTGAKPLTLFYVLNFMEHYEFVEIDRSAGTVRLWSGMKIFLDELKKLES